MNKIFNNNFTISIFALGCTLFVLQKMLIINKVNAKHIILEIIPIILTAVFSFVVFNLIKKKFKIEDNLVLNILMLITSILVLLSSLYDLFF